MVNNIHRVNIYATVPNAAKLFGRSRYTIYRMLDTIRQEGKFNDICIQPSPRGTMINITKFQEWLQSKHLAWVK